MKIVKLRDYGILPKTDITIALKKLFEQNSENTEFVFENDEYYFSPYDEMRYDYRISNSDPMPYRVLAVWLQCMKNCVLWDGWIVVLSSLRCRRKRFVPKKRN